MKDDDKEYIRAFAAMFAMNGLFAKGGDTEHVIEDAVFFADSLIDELQRGDTTGIASIKPKKKHDRKA